MPDIYDVDGPIQVQMDDVGGTFAGADTTIDIGHTLPTDRPQFDERNFEEPLISDEFGEEPEDFVNLGSIALISFTCVKVTLAQIVRLRIKMKYGATAKSGSNLVGDAGVVGLRALPSDNATFALRFLPPTIGQLITTFNLCKIDDNGVQKFGLGNAATRYAFSIRALRDSNGTFYTEVAVA